MLFAWVSISSFSFFARSPATRLICSKALILRLSANTAFLRGSKKFRAYPSFTSSRSPRCPTPSIVSCRITFMPLTPSVGKEKRILGDRQKVNSQCAEVIPRARSQGDHERKSTPVTGWTGVRARPYDDDRQTWNIFYGSHDRTRPSRNMGDPAGSRTDTGQQHSFRPTNYSCHRPTCPHHRHASSVRADTAARHIYRT